MLLADEQSLPMRVPFAFDYETFALACLLGLILGAGYEAVRGLRKGFRLGRVMEGVLDFFYTLLFFFGYFILSVARTGSMRAFTLAAMVMGLAAERFTLGRLLMPAFSQIFSIIYLIYDKSLGRLIAKMSQKGHIVFVHIKSKFRNFKKISKKVLKV